MKSLVIVRLCFLKLVDIYTKRFRKEWASKQSRIPQLTNGARELRHECFGYVVVSPGGCFGYVK
jgi:hypothetical protein